MCALCLIVVSTSHSVLCLIHSSPQSAAPAAQKASHRDLGSSTSSSSASASHDDDSSRGASSSAAHDDDDDDEPDSETDERALGDLAKDFVTPAMSLLYTPGGSAHLVRRCMHRLVEIRVPARHLHSQNKLVCARAVWGTGTYTDDSDIVAMLVHTGAFPVELTAPAKLHGVSVFCKVLPALPFYEASTRFGMTSKAWPTAHSRASLQIARVEAIERADLLDPKAAGSSTSGSTLLRTMHVEADRHPQRDRTDSLAKTKRKLAAIMTCVHSSTNEPWLKCVFDLCRLSSSNIPFCIYDSCLQQFMHLFTYCALPFSFSPCAAAHRYHPSIVQDAGPDAESFTTARLRRESIVFETPSGARFEISRDPPSSSSSSMSDSAASSLSPAGFDSYRFAQIFPSGSPLPAPADGGGDDDKAAASTTTASAASKEPARKRGGRHAQKDSGAASSATASSLSSSSSSSSSSVAGAAPRVPAAEDARLLVLHRGLDWTDFSWGADSVVVCERPYVVHAIIFQRNTA